MLEALIDLFAADILLQSKLIARTRDHSQLVAELCLQGIQLQVIALRCASVRGGVHYQTYLALEAIDGEIVSTNLRHHKLLLVY